MNEILFTVTKKILKENFNFMNEYYDSDDKEKVNEKFFKLHIHKEIYEYREILREEIITKIIKYQLNELIIKSNYILLFNNNPKTNIKKSLFNDLNYVIDYKNLNIYNSYVNNLKCLYNLLIIPQESITIRNIIIPNTEELLNLFDNQNIMNNNRDIINKLNIGNGFICAYINNKEKISF